MGVTVFFRGIGLFSGGRWGEDEDEGVEDVWKGGGVFIHHGARLGQLLLISFDSFFLLLLLLLLSIRQSEQE